ncbi:MAG: acetyl-CoA carboxylase biotin carboxylase subunit [Proteobacteria bacterium]|nr:acetyl-CoA carboxylase biotin carboxylase subunit [Pseudomonadota bacterium]
MFTKILIANRGEIACRVMSTCRKLGIKTVAVYSDADKDAMHVHMADEAVHIGGAQAADSYLKVDAILDAAKRTGAQAIHPGYGFLSENAGFAKACKKAGVVFIGPSEQAIIDMGSKSGAKAIMEKAKVPTLPGYHGENQDADFLKKQADKIGYPVLIKAVSGGGGRGMRRVNTPSEFAEALASAQREAKASFSDDRVLIEKLLEEPRHVEVQVFADSHGNAVYLFERDCSVQRRNQKVVEEAPAPNFDPKLRKQMGEAAVAAAKAVGYEGAGTVEFLFDGDKGFYFMEMNTRLQVEHPVTELITGTDLVHWQLIVAAGGKLPKTQDELAIGGHAVEVRLYAEDPDKNYLPGTGLLQLFDLPTDLEGVRIDTGFKTGDTVTPYYDAMLAKIIAWGPDRKTAIQRLLGALARTRVAGPKVNTRFLSAICGHPAFIAGEVNTKFIDTHAGALFHKPSAVTSTALALAAVAELLENPAADVRDPWGMTNGWRLWGNAPRMVRLGEGEDTLHTVAVQVLENNTYKVTALGQSHFVSATRAGALLTATVDGQSLTVTLSDDGETLRLESAAGEWVFTRRDLLADAEAAAEGAIGGLNAPTPGMVIKVNAKVGTKVVKGTGLMVLEAMKTEHHIIAPADGVIDAINFAVGDHVEKDAELIKFTPMEGAA